MFLHQIRDAARSERLFEPRYSQRMLSAASVRTSCTNIEVSLSNSDFSSPLNPVESPPADKVSATSLRRCPMMFWAYCDDSLRCERFGETESPCPATIVHHAVDDRDRFGRSGYARQICGSSSLAFSLPVTSPVRHTGTSRSPSCAIRGGDQSRPPAPGCRADPAATNPALMCSMSTNSFDCRQTSAISANLPVRNLVRGHSCDSLRPSISFGLCSLRPSPPQSNRNRKRCVSASTPYADQSCDSLPEFA